MEFKSINPNKISIDVILNSYQKGEFIPLSNREKKLIQTKFEEEVFKGKYIPAKILLLIGILFDSDNFFINIRKKGFFRYSNYINQKCIVAELAKEIKVIIESENIPILKSDKVYLDSIANFSSVKKSFDGLQKHIQNEINYFKKTYHDKSLVKSLLSYLDFLFLSNHFPNDKLELFNIEGRTKEQISEAVSYAIYLLSEINDFDKIDIEKIAEEYIITKRIDRILISACLISDLKEFEILIDYFEYTCINESDKLRILPPFEAFEKAIKHGYIRNDIQQANDFTYDEKATSLVDIVEKFTTEEGLNIFEYTETGGYPRYILKIPEPISDYLRDNIFKGEGIFLEEAIYLTKIFKEQLLNYDELSKIHVRDNLNLLEFIKIKRVFSFYQLLFSKKIFELEKVNTAVLLRSLIPIFRNETIYDLFKGVVSDEKLDAFLDVVYWDQNSDKFLDLQYHSFLFLNDTFLIPLTVFVHSNAVRNVFASEYKQNNERLLKDGKIDPLVERLNEILNAAKIENYINIPISGGEIDLLAFIDNKIIVFECKHSLNPTTIYELRTTHDYIKKANSQLNKINEKYISGELQESIKKNIGKDISEIDEIFSCIVLSNRMFNGNIFKFPVRNIHELENFFLRGTFKTEDGDFWLWRTNELSILDVIDYFNKNNPLLEHMQDTLNKYTLKYDFNSPPIEFDSYSLNLLDAKKSLSELTKNFRKVESELDKP